LLKSEKFDFLQKNVFTFVNAIVQQLKTIIMETLEDIINSYQEPEEDLNYLKERVRYLNLYEEYVWKNYDRIHRDATQYANINSN